MLFSIQSTTALLAILGNVEANTLVSSSTLSVYVPDIPIKMPPGNGKRYENNKAYTTTIGVSATAPIPELPTITAQASGLFHTSGGIYTSESTFGTTIEPVISTVAKPVTPETAVWNVPTSDSFRFLPAIQGSHTTIIDFHSTATPLPAPLTTSISTEGLLTTGVNGNRTYRAYIRTVTSYDPVTFSEAPSAAPTQGDYRLLACYSDTPGRNFAISGNHLNSRRVSVSLSAVRVNRPCLCLIDFSYVDLHLNHSDLAVEKLIHANTHQTSSEVMDLEPCEIFCRNARYIGLKNGNQCFCGDNIHDRAEVVDFQRCNIQCPGYPGDAPQSCGGDGVTIVYENGRKANRGLYTGPKPTWMHSPHRSQAAWRFQSNMMACMTTIAWAVWIAPFL